MLRTFSTASPSRRKWLRWGTAAASFAAFAHVLVLGETRLVRVLWAASIVTAVLGYARRPRVAAPRWPALLLFLVIFVTAAWLRLYQLGEIPDDYHGDIASQGFAARAFLDGTATQIFRTMWSDIPAFEFWQLAMTLRVLGDDLHGMSTNAAIHGLLSLIGLYLLASELLGVRVALVAAALLAISYTHIHFSRVFTTATPLSFMTFTCWSFARGTRTGSGPSFALAGVLLGLGSQTYYPARMLAVIFSVVVPWTYRFDKARWFHVRRGLAPLALGFFAAFGPFLAFALRNPTALIGRGSDVLVWSPSVSFHLQSKYGVESLSGVLWENAKRSLLMFTSYGDTSTHFGFPHPIVDPLTFVFLLCGLLVAIARMRSLWSAMMLVWLSGTILLGSVISNDPPFWPHLVVLLPPVAVLAAVGVDRAISLAARLGRAGTVVASAGVIVAIVATGARNWQLYYTFVRDNAAPAAKIGRIVEQSDPTYTIVLVKNPRSVAEREVAFVAAGRAVEDATAEQVLDSANAARRRVLYVITPNHGQVLAALRARHPAAQMRFYRAPDGGLMVTTVLVE